MVLGRALWSENVGESRQLDNDDDNWPTRGAHWLVTSHTGWTIMRPARTRVVNCSANFVCRPAPLPPLASPTRTALVEEKDNKICHCNCSRLNVSSLASNLLNLVRSLWCRAMQPNNWPGPSEVRDLCYAHEAHEASD